jgi:hypothetical protein
VRRKGPELDLIRDAVGDALARVRFFRLAFGYAGPDHMTSAREARTTLEALYDGGRIAATWKPQDDMPRRQVKLAYLMMLCAESALPMGGDVNAVDGTRRAMVACRPRRSHRDGGGRSGPSCASAPARLAARFGQRRCSSSRSMTRRRRWRARSTT